VGIFVVDIFRRLVKLCSCRDLWLRHYFVVNRSMGQFTSELIEINSGPVGNKIKKKHGHVFWV
jgi:hypothetical protein